MFFNNNYFFCVNIRRLFYFVVIIGAYSNRSVAETTNVEVTIMKARDLEPSLEICQGIAVHQNVVMTAAECVDGLLTTDLIVSHPRYLLISDVSKIIIHPAYTACNGSNNYAILITASIISTENSIARLPDEQYLEIAHSVKNCQLSPLTTTAFDDFWLDTDQCLYLSNSYQPELISNQICELKNEKIDNILKNRYVEVMICKFFTTDLQNLTYYYAHYTFTIICSNKEIDFIFNDLNYVYEVAPWIQEEIKKNVNGVPQVSTCILLLIACFVTHFST